VTTGDVLTGRRREERKPRRSRETDPFILALSQMVLADIRRERERRANLTVMDGGRKG
jgi:hypothetical protein